MPLYTVALRFKSWRGDRVASVPEMSNELSLVDRETYLEFTVGPVERPDGHHALAFARILGDRMARLLALSFSAFRVTGLRIAGPAGWDSIGDVSGEGKR